MYIELLLPLLLLLTAFLYSSVGHGGASGYLAILSLFSISPQEMKTSALVLNTLVSLIAFYHYRKEGYFDWKLFIGFAITSVPFSFVGAMIPLGDEVYKKMLGLVLIFPILKLWGIFKKQDESVIKETKWYLCTIIGAFIGILSGMLGIGGGILLSPLLILMHWSGMKKTAAVSALFVFVNSVSGIIGLHVKGMAFSSSMSLWIVVAVVGGFAGSFFGSKKFNSKSLSLLLSLVLTIASIKLLAS